MTEDIKGDAKTFMDYGRESIEERIPDECDFNTPCMMCPWANECVVLKDSLINSRTYNDPW